MDLANILKGLTPSDLTPIVHGGDKGIILISLQTLELKDLMRLPLRKLIFMKLQSSFFHSYTNTLLGFEPYYFSCLCYLRTELISFS